MVLNLLLVPAILIIGIIAYTLAIYAIGELHQILLEKVAITTLKIQHPLLAQISVGILLFTFLINNISIFKTIRGKE